MICVKPTVQLPLQSNQACLLQIMGVSVLALIVISRGTFLSASVDVSYIVDLFPLCITGQKDTFP